MISLYPEGALPNMKAALVCTLIVLAGSLGMNLLQKDTIEKLQSTATYHDAMDATGPCGTAFAIPVGNGRTVVAGQEVDDADVQKFSQKTAADGVVDIVQRTSDGDRLVVYRYRNTPR